MLPALPDLWPVVVSLAHIMVAAAVTVDAVLRKRHVQSIIGWVGLAWLAPFAGAVLYLAFGINRIRRTAAALKFQSTAENLTCVANQSAQPSPPAELAGLDRLGGLVTGKALATGNAIVPLRNGDEAFPVMLAAIDAARHSIALQTYIFDSDAVGCEFEAALLRAVERGVAVRVLVDDVGARYSRSSMIRRLRARGLRAAVFLPTRVPRLFRYANLRNHRKILVVDGRVGFTGGMNLREGHWLGRAPAHPVSCLHFSVTGPVVADLQRTFVLDWDFTTGETLMGEHWFPTLGSCGSISARGVADGPDEDLGKLPEFLLGALAEARYSAQIVTPYFLPDDVLLRTLQVTARRGVKITLLLPAKSNIRLMDWAMQPQLPYLLRSGCRVYLSPPPFDHTKLFIVDGRWSLIGSTNWDARSLRLNFEYNLECHDVALAGQLNAIVDDKLASARELELRTLDRRPAIRVRNGLARLLSPYL